MEWRLRLTIILQIIVTHHASEDFRHISYEDLVEKGRLFQENGVTMYSQLLFDVARQQVVVGARDNLYRLTLHSLTQLEHAIWTAPPEKISVCQDKGQTPADCHNFIKVLLSNGKRIFTCGTNAFSPQCTWREIENINNVTDRVSGVAMCPYSPHANVTAILARGSFGGLFAGTPTDFSGADSAIYRTLAFPNLRTHQYDSKWLNDPQFVDSFETEHHVFFLFRESAVEYINCGKRIYSRIARVCKNDPGGQTLMRDTWTTFSKARLNCSIPGEYPFYYDEIQGAVYLPEEGIVYATFTTPSNAIAGSAICAFNMSAIMASFNGPYKYQENSGATWERRSASNHNRQTCGQPSDSAVHQIIDNQRYQLMDDAVQSTTLKPLYIATLERFTHIAVDITPTKVHRSVTVLYVSTTTGLIKKISVLPKTLEACTVEVWGPLPSPPVILQFLKDTQSLYVGMKTGLLRISAAQCHRHRTQQACLNAQEPYCGWNELSMKCAQAPGQNPDVGHWHQDVTKCPVLMDPVEGGWSSWSPWHPCQYETGDLVSGNSQSHHNSHKTENMDGCQCQTRECNNPPPKNGGTGCEGAKVKVANCTVHGGWTSWSAWSACSQTCGLAMKTRRRTCTNPAPAFGGRICVGHDHDENVCIALPPCAQPSKSTSPPQNGQWSSWGPWNACNRACNGGLRIRKRTCDNPSPREGGAMCIGCSIQVEDCNTHACTETKRYSNWTPWLTSNVTAQGLAHTEKRFRFSCRAQSDDPTSLRIHLAKEEERYCRNDGSCTHGIGLTTVEGNLEDGWSEWSSWFPCNRICNGGSQYRVRQCDTSACEGLSIESRTCNTHPCRGIELKRNKGGAQWSCWTDWSPCSVSCGVGVRTRKRECLEPNACQGSSVVNEFCEMPSCESLLGWDNWSEWSICNFGGQQHRKRKCLLQSISGACKGFNQEERDCISDYDNNEVTSSITRNIETAGVSVGAVTGSFIAGLIVGMVFMSTVFFFYLKKKTPRILGSPHYITKQNPYVVVPLKEVTAKRQASFSGTTNGTGTLRGKNNANANGLGSPKLYPKSLDNESTTLKRNSHGQQHIRADLEQDKYY